MGYECKRALISCPQCFTVLAYGLVTNELLRVPGALLSTDDEDFGEGEDVSSTTPVAPIPTATAWDDEDAEEEQDPEEAKAARKAPAPMKPSKEKELAIKRKEEEQAKKARAAALRRQKELDEMTPEERKTKREQMIRDSDLEAAKDLFMGGAGVGVSKPQGDSLDTFKAKTDDDYRKFAAMMGNKARELNTNKKRPARYVQFVKDLMKELTEDLGPDDVGEVSQSMTNLTNQKRDEYKKAKGIGKKKGKKKATVKMDRADQDFSAFDDDIYDDFM